jgi:exodeoxyribonuclease-3
VHPMEVAWPFTQKLEEQGFVDLFRSVYPDPLLKPGFTWSPNIPPETAAATVDDHRDRIDFIFGKGQSLKVLSAAVVGETGPYTDIAVDPYPSDHRAVVTVVEF